MARSSRHRGSPSDSVKRRAEAGFTSVRLGALAFLLGTVGCADRRGLGHLEPMEDFFRHRNRTAQKAYVYDVEHGGLLDLTEWHGWRETGLPRASVASDILAAVRENSTALPTPDTYSSAMDTHWIILENGHRSLLIHCGAEGFAVGSEMEHPFLNARLALILKDVIEGNKSHKRAQGNPSTRTLRGFLGDPQRGGTRD